jgi:CRP-like cAMP-binding protein
LDIQLASPEYEIVKQGSNDGHGMFFIQTGECSDIIEEKIGLESSIKQIRLLYGGDHFGEISLVYNCHRSATVIANNYCTLARLSQENFKEITNKYPTFLHNLKDQIYMYDDPIKLFLEVQLKKIPYMERVDTDTFHDVMFNFKQETCDKSTYIFKEGETSNGLFLVKREL